MCLWSCAHRYTLTSTIKQHGCTVTICLYCVLGIQRMFPCSHLDFEASIKDSPSENRSMRFQPLIIDNAPRYVHPVRREISDRSHWTSKQETAPDAKERSLQSLSARGGETVGTRLHAPEGCILIANAAHRVHFAINIQYKCWPYPMVGQHS